MVKVNDKHRPEKEQMANVAEAFTKCHVLVGHNGGTEVARYVAHHCTRCVAAAAGEVNSYGGLKAFSETDFTDDMKRFDSPTLVLHGEDGQIVPVKDSAWNSAKLTEGGGKLSCQSPARTHGHKSAIESTPTAGVFLESSQRLGGGLAQPKMLGIKRSPLITCRHSKTAEVHETQSFD